MPENKPMEQITKGKVINTFVSKMMADKGVEDAALKEQLEAKLEEQIEQAMIRMLPDEKLVELEGMLDREASDEEIEQFFDGSGVNFEQVAQQTMAAFRSAFSARGAEA